MIERSRMYGTCHVFTPRVVRLGVRTRGMAREMCTAVGERLVMACSRASPQRWRRAPRPPEPQGLAAGLGSGPA